MDGCNLLAYESWSSKCRIFPIMTTFTYESFSRAVWRWCLDPNSTSSERVRPGSVGVKSSQTSQHKSTCQGVVKHTEENVVALKKSWFSSLDKLVTLRDISRCDLDPAPAQRAKKPRVGIFSLSIAHGLPGPNYGGPSIYGWTDTPNVRLYNGLQKERNSDTCYFIDEHAGRYAECSKSGIVWGI